MSRRMETKRKDKPPGAANDWQWKKLAAFVGSARGFSLAVVVCDQTKTAEILLERLIRLSDPGELEHTVLDLTPFSEERWLLERLDEHLIHLRSVEGQRLAVHVLAGEPSLGLLQTANVQRDALPRVCPYPLLLWITGRTAQRLAVEAPDLWDWRMAAFEFVGGQTVTEISAAERDLEASRQIGDHRRQADALTRLAAAYEELGDAVRAMAVLDEAWTVAHAEHDPQMENRVVECIGQLYRRRPELQPVGAD